MSVLRRGRHPIVRSLAAALLVVQGWGAGTVGLAHAGEALAAPLAIEAHHSGGCVIVHNPARCTTCQIGGAAPVPQSQRHALAPEGPRSCATAVATVAPPARALSRATPPRAPPVFSA